MILIHDYCSSSLLQAYCMIDTFLCVIETKYPVDPMPASFLPAVGVDRKGIYPQFVEVDCVQDVHFVALHWH
jgi:hypothetical protein